VADAIATSTRQYAKRQETWFRHQIRAPALVLDATRPAEELAQHIATQWKAARAAHD
jgi:tRNA A37 N6-isopentenylltransferase MiaA